MVNLVELYCFVDDFSKLFMPEFEKNQLESGMKKRKKCCRLSESEIMVILIHFHPMRFRDFKTYDTKNDQLKNISQIEHTRHRNIQNFMVNYTITIRD